MQFKSSTLDSMNDLKSFYEGKRVFLTGHTGFKGAWLTHILRNKLNAEVFGYSLNPPTNPSLYSILGNSSDFNEVIGDVRDFNLLKQTIANFSPDVVLHLAAQPLVRYSYKHPRDTYETNVMGTVNLLQACVCTDSVRSIVNVTTDKVYKNEEWCWGYRECEPLDGYDPYSNSKSCSELVTHSYSHSFFEQKGVAVSTARAGNVIGGGDFSEDRIIPDCVRASLQCVPISIRNPYSIRPYQHVIEPLYAYLLIAMKQSSDPTLAGAYNIGPDDRDCVTTGELADLFCRYWDGCAFWEYVAKENQPHESNVLKLDNSKIKQRIGWYPKWDINQAVLATCEWFNAFKKNGNIVQVMEKQIDEYFFK